LICTSLCLNLENPRVINQGLMLEIFNRIPSTRNPGTITPEELHKLKQLCEV
jgi:hypothetical protein